MRRRSRRQVAAALDRPARRLPLILMMLCFLGSAFPQDYIVLNEPFEGNSNGWPEGQNAGGSVKIRDGKFCLQSQKEGLVAAIGLPGLKQSSDFKIEANIVNAAEGSSGGGFGIVWGYKDADNLIFLTMASSGFYKVVRLENGKPTFATESAHSSLLRTAAWSGNRITIKRIAGKLELYFNGLRACSIDDLAFLGNGCGLFVSSPAQIEVEDLLVTTAAESTAPRCDITVFAEYFTNPGDSTWAVGTNGVFETKIDKGYYLIRGTEAKNTSRYFGRRVDCLDNFQQYRIQGKFRHLGGAADRPFGLIWGWEDNGNANEFKIAPTGSFKILRDEGGTTTSIADWTVSEAIRKGDGADNTLRIEKNSLELSYFINGTKVFTSPVLPVPMLSRVGFMSPDTQSNAVDELLVSLEAGSTLSIDREWVTSYRDDFVDNRNAWETRSGDFSLRIANDELVVQTSGAGGFATRPIDLDLGADFILKARLIQDQGQTDLAYGIVLQSADTAFCFVMNRDRRFRIFQERSGSVETIRDWKELDSRIPTLWTYTMEIRKKDNELSFWINEWDVHRMAYRPLPRGRVGFAVSGVSTVKVSFLEIRQLVKYVP